MRKPRRRRLSNLPEFTEPNREGKFRPRRWPLGDASCGPLRPHRLSQPPTRQHRTGLFLADPRTGARSQRMVSERPAGGAELPLSTRGRLGHRTHRAGSPPAPGRNLS